MTGAVKTILTCGVVAVTYISLGSVAGNFSFATALHPDTNQPQSDSIRAADPVAMQERVHNARVHLLRLAPQASKLEQIRVQTEAVSALAQIADQAEAGHELPADLLQGATDLISVCFDTNALSSTSVYQALRILVLLPDSDRKSELVISALDASNDNSNLVWDLMLNQHVSADELARIRRNVLESEDINEIRLYELALLATHGHEFDYLMLQRVLEWSRQLTATGEVRVTSGRRPSNIEALTDLQVVRDDSARLLGWAIDTQDGNFNSISRWALRRASEVARDDQAVWMRFWSQLETRIDTRVQNMIAQSSETAIPGEQLRDTLTASMLRPWVTYLTQQGIQAPKQIVDFIEHTPHFPAHSVN